MHIKQTAKVADPILAARIAIVITVISKSHTSEPLLTCSTPVKLDCFSFGIGVWETDGFMTFDGKT